MRTDYEFLEVHVDKGIVDVVLNRPEKRNALTFQMQADFDQILKEAMVDDEVKVLMLRGALGKVFCAGHDLKEAADNYVETGQFHCCRSVRPPEPP